jgi:carbonic anhydrase
MPAIYAPAVGKDRRLSLLDGQEPFAIILGCADSRVPAEIVFDQGLGDLFVIRIAGNIIAPSLVESVEFAALRLHTKTGGGAGAQSMWCHFSDI